MKPKFGVVVFPGSNSDHDAYYSAKHVMGYDADFIWHKEHNLKNCDVIILPGGFSYGDYLRTGSIASLSPIMQEVIEFAEKGGIVVGFCNGFQILCESKLLPGVLLKNNSLKFRCKDVYLKVDNKKTIFTGSGTPDVVRIPIAHGEGNYFIEQKGLGEIEAAGQVVFRYCDENGNISEEANPNGSLNNIAGIMNKRGNVLGMMPHPERVCNPMVGNTDGQYLFKSVFESIIN